MMDETWYVRPRGMSSEVSAGGVVARLVNGAVKIALVRESDDAAYFLPKGRVERGESIERAAMREIGEEAGVHELTLIEKLGVRERLNFTRTSWKRIHYFLFCTTQINGAPTDEAHNYKVRWFDLDHLPPMIWREQYELIIEHREKIEHAARG